MFGSDLIKVQPVTDMVDKYNEASALIERAYLDLERARKMLGDTFGEQAYIHVVDRQNLEFGEKGYAHIKKEIKKRIWIRLVQLLQIRRFLSVRRSEDLSKQLEKNEMPDITAQAVYETIETLRQNSTEFVREAVWEVFDLLRPGSRKPGMSLKTNQKYGRFALGRKVILSGYLENVYGDRLRCSHYRSNEVRSIDRVFHALDGREMTDGYLSPLMDAVNTCDRVGETDYFKFKCCQNRNLHLEFRRMDLVKQLNLIAGDRTVLQGENTQ